MATASRLSSALRTGVSRISGAVSRTPVRTGPRACLLCASGTHAPSFHQAGAYSTRHFHASAPRLQQDESAEKAGKAGPTAATDAKPPVESNGEKATEAKDAEIQRLQKELADQKQKFLYAAAQLQNVQRSAKEDVARERKFGIEKFAKDLLVIADNLSMALSSTPKDQLAGNKPLADLYQGLSLTQDELNKVFKQHRLLRFEPVDEKFNPNEMMGLMRAPHPTKTPGTVLQVAKVGYKLEDRVIRAADVIIVADRPADAKP